ncbi:hypothetical protein JOY44_27740 (plasmid) [Phormidium sp. CLA17]|uniref:hypothetical protein n=1 Tax=Leptolyngbya sp. Cla-17 TaxID=2803751 RepID=UPI0014911D3B|nr:hypothetical protein [Leptolyngbya sp. Cla-17]MBM0745267.1 hypothetical protein [Leptolyngbya sp. Cla-17]
MKIWIVPLLAIAALTVTIVSVKAERNPYGKILTDLWAEGSRLEKQRDFAGAQRLYEKALQQSQTLPDSLVKRCAIAISRVELESMIAAQTYIREHGNDPKLREGIEITIIQQSYASWEKIGRELKLLSTDCPSSHCFSSITQFSLLYYGA